MYICNYTNGVRFTKLHHATTMQTPTFVHFNVTATQTPTFVLFNVRMCKRKIIIVFSILQLGHEPPPPPPPPPPPITFYGNWMIDPIKLLHSCHHDFPIWVSLLVLMLSNDAELNPVDYLREGFLSFCKWNINSLSKDNFQLVPLLETLNSLFNYDIISLCETSLNDMIDIPDKLIENYKFIPCNSPVVKNKVVLGSFTRMHYL